MKNVEDCCICKLKKIYNNSPFNYIFVLSDIAAESIWVVSIGAGVTTVVVSVVVMFAESVSVAALSPLPQAAKAPRAKTNNSFFIVVNVFCVSEFGIYTLY